jgi:hypothetical protein
MAIKVQGWRENREGVWVKSFPGDRRVKGYIQPKSGGVYEGRVAFVYGLPTVSFIPKDEVSRVVFDVTNKYPVQCLEEAIDQMNAELIKLAKVTTGKPDPGEEEA